MDTLVERVDVWAASIPDRSGALAGILAGLRNAGADLQFVLARRESGRPGIGTVFVTPLQGDSEVAAAAELGFSVTSKVQCVRVDGDNEPGVAARLTRALADAGINLRGLSAAANGTRFVAYFGLDSAADAARAMKVLGRG